MKRDARSLAEFRPLRAVALVVLGLVIGGCGEEKPLQIKLDTPADAVRSLCGAIAARDATGVESCLLQRTPREKAFAQALGRLLDASSRLQQAAASHFDDATAAKSLAGIGPLPVGYEKFIRGTEVEQGDEATLTAADGRMLSLHRMDGQWKIVPPGEFASTLASEESLADVTEFISAAADLLDSIGKQVESDTGRKQFATIDDLKAAVSTELNQLLSHSALTSAAYR